MADKTSIEWTDATWNPTTGCSIVSPGCTNCYAMNVANGLERRFDSPKYRGLTKVVNGNAVWTGEVRLHEAALLQPLKWKRGRRIFVNSMSDLFHEALSDADIDRVFAVMALCPQHTFQVLTKRSERMRAYMAASESRLRDLVSKPAPERLGDYLGTVGAQNLQWPLPNVWLGISAERQKEADERVPHLLGTPAAIRFVSAEPLLGPIEFTNLNYAGNRLNALAGTCEPHSITFSGLDWVIVGGESGQGAREHDIAWSRDIIAQCRTAGVYVFEKQLGARPFEREPSAWPNGTPHGDGSMSLMPDGFGRYFVTGLKSKKGGDWSEWPQDLRVREFPEVRT